MGSAARRSPDGGEVRRHGYLHDEPAEWPRGREQTAQVHGHRPEHAGRSASGRSGKWPRAFCCPTPSKGGGVPLRQRPARACGVDGRAAVAGWHDVAGVRGELLDPGTVRFFALFLPPFVAPDPGTAGAGNVTLQLLVPGVLVPLAAIPADLVVAWPGGTIARSLNDSRKARELMGWAGGLVLTQEPPRPSFMPQGIVAAARSCRRCPIAETLRTGSHPAQARP